MITLLLSACLAPQIEGFDLDRFLADQVPPPVEEVWERLGPVPDLAHLLNPDREQEAGANAPSAAEAVPGDLALRLEEIDSWDERIISTRKAGELLDSALWAGMQASELQGILPPGHPLIAASLGHLSFALYQLDRNAESRDITLCALDMELDAFGRTNDRTRESLLRLAYRCERLEEEATSEIALRHGLDIAIACHGPASREAGRLASNLATTLSSLGKTTEALATYDRSLQIYEEADGLSSDAVAILCSNIAQIYVQIGRSDEALDLLNRALDIHRERDQLDSRAAIVCLLITSDLCPPTQALDYLEEAMDLADRVLKPEDPIWPTALSQYGWGLVKARELDAAEAPLRRALEIQTKRYGPKSIAVADVNNNLAGLMQARGQILEALALFKESFELKRSLIPKDHPSLIRGLNNLAVLHMRADQFKEAEEAWKQGLDLCHRILPENHEDTALLLTNYGGLLDILMRHEEAEPMLREALDMRRALLGSHPYTGDSEVSLAQILLSNDRVDEAEQLLAEAEEIHRNALGTNGLGLPSVLRVRAMAQRIKGESEAAYRTSLEAFEIIDAQKSELVGTPSEEALFASAISHGSMAALHAVMAIDLGRTEEALVIFERARGRMMLDLLNARDTRSPRWKATSVTPPKTVQDTLGPNERIRAYFWSDQSLIIYDVGANDMRAEVRVWGRRAMQAVQQDVERYVRLLADPTQSEGQAAMGRRLAGVLWPGSSESPERWILVPDGPLQTLPFDALPLPAANTSEFVYASSSTLYHDRCRVAATRDRSRPMHLLAVGDPTFAASSGLAPLRATRSEVENAGRLVRGSGGVSQVLLGTAATLANIEQAAETCTVLHLASHGQAGSPEDPLSASVALADGPDGTSNLTLRRLFEDWQAELPLCELVVLSACETQKATEVGDSLMALSWGFFYAGAPTVLATLWKVDDRATALLMGHFYENLLNGEGNSKLTALSKAKRWLATANRRDIRAYERELGLDEIDGETLRSPGAAGAMNAGLLTPYADPAYWAGFVLLGSPE